MRLRDTIDIARRQGACTSTAPDWPTLGLRQIDAALGPIPPGTVGLLGAATGCGKSSIMLWAALNSPTAGIISLEDGPLVVGTRTLSLASGVDAREMLTGLSPEDQEKVDHAEQRIAELDFPLVEVAVGADTLAVERAVDKLAQAGCRTIWIDYLQKVRPGEDAPEDRRTAINVLWGALQRAAIRHDVVVIGISQLGRNAQEGEPSLHSFKESGDLENECRFALLAHRSVDSPTVVLTVAKGLFGGVGTQMVFERVNGALKPVW